MENETTALTLQDLKLLQNIVKVSTSRGAFQAEELSAVGAIYDKLSQFLASVEQQGNDNETAEQDSADAEATETGETND